MKKYLKILILAVMLVAAFMLLCSCDAFGLGGSKRTELPELDGEKTELVKEDAVELYDELMSYGAGNGVQDYKSVMDMVKSSEAFSTPASTEKYVSYIAECEKSAFENGGSIDLDDGTSATVLFGAKDGEMLLIVLRDGVMYVIFLELDLPPEEKPVWPSDEEFGKYHISLKQAEGTTLSIVTITTKETDTFAEFDSIYVDMKDADRADYEAYIKAVKDAGYVLEPHGDNWDGQENYVAYKVVGKTSYGCEVRLIDGNRVSVDFWNETQNIQRDRGVLLSDVWKKGTFIVRSEYMFTPEYQPEPEKENAAGGGTVSDKENEKNPTGPYLRTDFMVMSFSERGYFEMWNSDLENPKTTKDYVFKNCSAEIYDYQYKKVYTTTNYGKNIKLSHEHENSTPDEIAAKFRYSIERHVSDRGTTIGSNYALAKSLKKTGNKNIIAGIECVEYTGTCVAVDGENRIIWDATFNVWEEYNIALSYRGQRWWSDSTEYYEEYMLVTEDSWLDYALGLPMYGEYTKEFPKDEIKADLGFELPEVEGADGYFVEAINRSPDSDRGELQLSNVYHVGGLSYDEYLKYRREIEKLGFRLEDEWVSPYMYRESDNARITLSMTYSEQKREMTFEVVVEKTNSVILAPVGVYTIYYIAAFDEEKTVTFTFYKNGDVMTEDTYGNRVLYEKIGNYTYKKGEAQINVIHIYSDIGSQFAINPNYTKDWNLTRVGTDTVGGLSVGVYESRDGIIKVWILEESGFILKRTDSGKITVELVEFAEA